jgi:predicted AlkP superfamily pyrophosphatase or phosphodiesterase
MSTDRGLVLVLIDGLPSWATVHMGSLGGMVGALGGYRGDLRSSLPTLSKPLYHSIFTGREPLASAMASNSSPPPPRDPGNLFAAARALGYGTCCAAHIWVGELFGGTGGELKRFVIDPEGDIQRGIYYWDDAYPDSHAVEDGKHLIGTADGRCLALVHTMGVDFAAHRYGGESREFAQAVMGADQTVAEAALRWLGEGFWVMVTADHGVNRHGLHGGESDQETLVPLWILPPRGGRIPQGAEELRRQLDLKAFVLDVLAEGVRGS